MKADAILEAGKRRCEACIWTGIAKEVDPSRERCGYRGQFWWETDLPYFIRQGIEIEECLHWEANEFPPSV